MKFSALNGLKYSHSISISSAKPSNRQRVLSTMETVPTLTAVFLTARYLGWTSDRWRKGGIAPGWTGGSCCHTRLQATLNTITTPTSHVSYQGFLDTHFRAHWKLHCSCSNVPLWQKVDIEILCPGFDSRQSLDISVTIARKGHKSYPGLLRTRSGNVQNLISIPSTGLA